MKRISIILALLLPAWTAVAQVVFKTVVPQQSVVEGESFQVQYVVEDGEMVTNFVAPDFRGFQKVTGPYIYSGEKDLQSGKPIRNTVFTLKALKPGRFVIRGAIAIINGHSYSSNDMIIDVISHEEAARRTGKANDPDNQDYFLRPGEDPYEKIRKNLFVKMQVSKKTCFVGEPVVATFKLYSRLESRSDIIKNPGFYGFTVYDMVSLTDRERKTELIDGKSFDVHTIRQVQLYPLQEGIFSVDGMDVKNSVEFSRSMVSKKTEQEIIEGVLHDNNTVHDGGEGTATYETVIHTAPVAIIVKPLPLKNKPTTFNGATGLFSIHAAVLKNELAKNEQGVLEIVIAGSGNFTQLGAPVISWPSGLEGFEPVIKDSLDKTKVPLTGSRIFHYAFVSIDTGTHTIPPATLSFFNPDSGTFKTITTPAISVSISDAAGTIKAGSPATVSNRTAGNSLVYWLAGGLVLLLIIGGFLFWRINSKKAKQTTPSVQPLPVINPPVAELLAPAYLLVQGDDKDFYTALQQAIWKFFSHYLGLSGSELTKTRLNSLLKEKKINPELSGRIQSILQQCEEGMFTSANLFADKKAILEASGETLEKLSALLL